jgi:hypothetical protein
VTLAALYAYAVVAADAPVPVLKAILPEAPILAVRHGGLAVLVSPVPRALFETGSPEARTADPAWMAARATRHHAVVMAASEPGPALPLAFGALFSDEAALLAWLMAHEATLAAALPLVADAAEWSLSLSADAPRHAAWLAAHDPALAALRRQAEAAAPGTAYLLRKRLGKVEQGVRAAHLEATLQRLADMTAGVARHTAAMAPRGDRAGGITALVPRAQAGTLHSAIAALASSCQEAGLAAELSGPWPPYAFAREVAQRMARPRHEAAHV